MRPDVQNMLIKKRHIELECLGVPPQIYYKAVQLIERHVYVVIKEDKVLIFKKHDLGLHDCNSKDTSKYFDADKIIKLMHEVFGLNNILGYNIYSEWIREKVIYCRMTERSDKYWDFLCLPTTYVTEADEPDEYNF